jgi:hypothetical protein
VSALSFNGARTLYAWRDSQDHEAASELHEGFPLAIRLAYSSLQLLAHNSSSWNTTTVRGLFQPF